MHVQLPEAQLKIVAVPRGHRKHTSANNYPFTSSVFVPFEPRELSYLGLVHRSLHTLTIFFLQMGNVFGERFPEAQVITSEFVDYVDEGETIKQEKVVGAEAAEGQDGSVGGDNGGGKGSAVGTIVFNAVFGNVWDQMEALERAATLLEVCILCFQRLGSCGASRSGSVASKTQQELVHGVAVWNEARRSR